MSLNQNYSEQTVLKALHWLNRQPDNWSEHVKDSNVAVKMYLKSQKKNGKKESSFAKEVAQVLKTEVEESPPFRQEELKEEELGAFLMNKPQTSSPANGSLHNSLFEEDIKTSVSEGKKTLIDFLDERSLQTLKQTKSQLNIRSEEEALRLLVQLGRNCLEKLFSN